MLFMSEGFATVPNFFEGLGKLENYFGLLGHGTHRVLRLDMEGVPAWGSHHAATAKNPRLKLLVTSFRVLGDGSLWVAVGVVLEKRCFWFPRTDCRTAHGCRCRWLTGAGMLTGVGSGQYCWLLQSDLCGVSK